MTANDVIDKYLVTQEAVTILESPEGPVRSTLPKGRVIGPVYSWVQNGRDVYWMFDYTIPGEMPGAYYVKHKKGRFKIGVSGTGTDPENGIFDGGFLNTTTVMPKAKQLWYLIPAIIVLVLIFKRVKK